MSVPADAAFQLPDWTQASPRRRVHIERVVALLAGWATLARLPEAEQRAWIDAGRFHDALRDADEADLRRWTSDRESPAALLHGPAAAVVLESRGELRADVLDAVRYHTVGSADWSRTGQALYMADYLEPGRTFDTAARAAIAARVPDEFDACFRKVVRMRRDRAVSADRPIPAQTAGLWERFA